jgi:hypothetical protein
MAAVYRMPDQQVQLNFVVSRKTERSPRERVFKAFCGGEQVRRKVFRSHSRVGSKENATLVRGEHGNFPREADGLSADLLFFHNHCSLTQNRRLTRLRLASSQNHDAG